MECERKEVNNDQRGHKQFCEIRVVRLAKLALERCHFEGSGGAGRGGGGVLKISVRGKKM